MSCVMQYNPTDVIYSTLLDLILRSYYLVCILSIILSVALLSHKHVIPATGVDIYFLLTWRLTVNTGGGSSSSSSALDFVTLYHDHYWLVVFNPITADKR